MKNLTLRNSLKALAGVAVLGLTANASAVAVSPITSVAHNFTVIDNPNSISFTGAPGGFLIAEKNGKVEFNFGTSGSNHGGITKVYLESGFDQFLDATSMKYKTVNGNKPAAGIETNPVGPGSHLKPAWTSSLIEVFINDGGLDENGERLALNYKMDNGNFSDLASLIGTEGYRIAADFGNGQSMALLGTQGMSVGTHAKAVPTPSAFAAGLGLIGIAAARRRRQPAA